MQKNKKKKLLTKKDWIIALLSFAGTMAGVSGAFTLDHIKEKNAIDNNKKVIIKNIQKEISGNLVDLQKNISDNKNSLKSLVAIRKVQNHKGEIQTTPALLRALNNTHPQIFIAKDSVLVANNTFKYSGQYSIYLEILSLSNIAWETTKSINILSEIEFDCLYNLEALYNLQLVAVEKSESMIPSLQQGNFKELIASIQILLQYENELLQLYEQLDIHYDKCK